METNHTPLPWKVCNDGYNIYAPASDTAITASDSPCFPNCDEADANATFIVTACNNHYNLMATLQMIDRYVKVLQLNRHTEIDPELLSIAEITRAAIQKVLEATHA